MGAVTTAFRYTVWPDSRFISPRKPAAPWRTISLPGGVLDRGLALQDRDERVALVADAEQDVSHRRRCAPRRPPPASPAATETGPPIRDWPCAQSTCRPSLARSPEWAYGGARAGHKPPTTGVGRGGGARPRCPGRLRRERRGRRRRGQLPDAVAEPGAKAPAAPAGWVTLKDARTEASPGRGAARVRPGGPQGRLRPEAGRPDHHLLARGHRRQPRRLRRRAAAPDRRQGGLARERRRRADGGGRRRQGPRDVRRPPRRRPARGDHRARRRRSPTCSGSAGRPRVAWPCAPPRAPVAAGR